jgi:hypothetical protein
VPSTSDTIQEVSVKSLFLLIPALAVVGAAIPTAAVAQQRGTQAQQADNARQAAELRARFDQADVRIGKAERSKAISRPRAIKLRQQVAQSRQSMTGLSRRQGFVSAAELASYNRTLDAIDVELDRRGVERSYGNDALLSAEMIAFQKVDARLGYRDARFEYDAEECAVYQGKAPDGKVRRERLLSASGRPFCTSR